MRTEVTTKQAELIRDALKEKLDREPNNTGLKSLLEWWIRKLNREQSSDHFVNIHEAPLKSREKPTTIRGISID